MFKNYKPYQLVLRILFAVYVVLVLWWITIFFRGIQNIPENYIFSLIYGFIPLGIGIFGFFNSWRWGGFKSAVGRAVFFLSAGQFAWGIGNIIFSYYQLVLHVPVPYPGYADGGYFLLYPLSAIGILCLFRVTGATAGLRSLGGKMSFILIPAFFIGISYYLLYKVALAGSITYQGSILKFILDVGYPIGDVVVITLAAMVLWLSRNYLGGLFKKPILLILVGFVFAYICDFSFSYTTTLETFFTGNWIDLLYTTTFFIIAVGLTLLNPELVPSESQNKV